VGKSPPCLLSRAALSDFIGSDDGSPLPISIFRSFIASGNLAVQVRFGQAVIVIGLLRWSGIQRGTRIGTLGGHYRFSFVVHATGHHMRIVEHPESHIVRLDDGSTWQIFPGDIDRTLAWLPTTELRLFEINDEVASHALINSDDGTRVRVRPQGEQWPIGKLKDLLKQR
jgi:hypothetical protein